MTGHPSAGLWVALGALAVVGAVLQIWVTGGERRARRGGATVPAPQPAGGVPRGVVNVISGGVQQGPVLQGRDFTSLSFGVPSDRPPDQLPGEDGDVTTAGRGR